MAKVKSRLAATVPVTPPLARRFLRFSHPGKLPPGCKAQRRFAPALSVVAAGACSFLAWFFHPFESFRRG
ncbi:hypothetical protein [Salmonella sp. SKLX119062]|uniref:hypothetical protein n=1 Tax=unclassified Salmonella TaxID=2614656 RepID=UPI00091BB27F|nr:hypothetical protein [Salmonella enterica]EME0072881.1 hypothetical protein [Salmonella enterica]MBO2076555.1 hypothetical protein [Salmonella sp. 32020501-2019-00050]OIZ42200.1 hypothetical protein BEH73_21355 [Citrobacter freundii]HBM0115620.1 hypothetical protein [Salmonella enterica subsp. enterica serovar Wandsworth]